MSIHGDHIVTVTIEDTPEPSGCQCECHKAKHTARPPHPATMAGRK